MGSPSGRCHSAKKSDLGTSTRTILVGLLCQLSERREHYVFFFFLHLLFWCARYRHARGARRYMTCKFLPKVNRHAAGALENTENWLLTTEIEPFLIGATEGAMFRIYSRGRKSLLVTMHLHWLPTSSPGYCIFSRGFPPTAHRPLEVFAASLCSLFSRNRSCSAFLVWTCKNQTKFQEINDEKLSAVACGARDDQIAANCCTDSASLSRDLASLIVVDHVFGSAVPGRLEVGDQVVWRPDGWPQRAQQRGSGRPRRTTWTQVYLYAKYASWWGRRECTHVAAACGRELLWS